MVSGGGQDELRRLRVENARLKELLTQHEREFFHAIEALAGKQEEGA